MAKEIFLESALIEFFKSFSRQDLHVVIFEVNSSFRESWRFMML